MYKQKKELSDGPGNEGLTEGSQILVVEGTIVVTASGEVRTGCHEESLVRQVKVLVMTLRQCYIRELAY